LQPSLPKELLESLKGSTGFDEEAFLKVHQSGEQVTSIRLNPLKGPMNKYPELLKTEGRIPWSSLGYYLAERPSFTLDPVFHAGGYYVQEASGMFLEQAIKQTADLSKTLRILDLCAAPGGKSTLIQSLITEDSLLVSNEVIRTRVNILRENMIKWGGSNVFVTNNDPLDFSGLSNYFDVILVDAPCSGSGLFRREPASIQEWSLDQVELCGRRQERILTDIWPALKQDGILIYATCSFSKRENEDILDWILSAFSAESLALKLDPDWKLTEVISDKHRARGYRFYPDKVKGEGFFVSCLKKKDGSLFSYPNFKKHGSEKISRSEESMLNDWIDGHSSSTFFRREDFVHALPTELIKDLLLFQSISYLKKAGIRLGKLIGKELIPDHELALSRIAGRNIPSLSLSIEQATQFLRREEMQLEPGFKGWSLVNYHGYELGWIKILDKRINNYYPKEWRITKSG
jgi:16S rRNA C967 or C1407 C5-methylase (RsmB/RsmF family)/NOL1/NOP2/fmu family ribosome biogenesis protein